MSKLVGNSQFDATQDTTTDPIVSTVRAKHPSPWDAIPQLIVSDTKTGREKKGLNKRTQLTERLYERELSVLDGDDDEPPLDAASDDADGEFLADELPEDD